MRLADRVLIAVTVLVVDLVTVGIPLTALAAAFVIVARPSWFLRLVESLYAEPRP